MKKIGIIGATGYAGLELLRLLLTHKKVEIAAISSSSFEGEKIDKIYQNLRGYSNAVLTNEDSVIELSDVVFAALPHGLSEKLAKKCFSQNKLFIDLGADFRLDNEDEFKEWYGLDYSEKELHQNAVYCIPELHRNLLDNKKIIANPGCYPTSISLGLAPILAEKKIDLDSIIIDSKSGATGAGRGLALNTHYTECNEAFAPYKIASHRHTPEIEQNLSKLADKNIKVTFVPHLLPINRGIVSTMYAKLNQDILLDELHKIYANFYKNEKFVRVLEKGEVANLKYVKCSNYCDISIHKDEHTNRIIIVSVIDNMVKGAAGQAIQNMNIICGFDEAEGLDAIPPAF